MGKSDQKAARQDINKQKGVIQQKSDEFTAGLKPQEAGYTDFATTGGVTPGMSDEIRSQSTGRLNSLYGDLSNRLNQSKSIQGGYSPGFGAQLAELGRNQSQAQSQGTIDANVSIDDMIRNGRLAGLGGLGGTNQLKLNNMLGTGQNINQLLGQKGSLAMTPGPFDNILRAASTASQFMPRPRQ